MNSSRLLARLDAAIAAAANYHQLHCLRIERACYLVRRGQFDDAGATLLELRRLYEKSPNAEVSAWLSLGEGLLVHFSNMGQQARDKINRAYALSAAAGLVQLKALSAAWLANMDYLVVDMPAMTEHVRQALASANGANHSALSRANLVVAHAYHLSGRLDLAKPWYAGAHKHASAEGDDATIGAFMHNMAWLRSANLRQQTFCGMPASPSGEHARVSAESTLQFESLFGATSLDALSPILRAQISTMEGHFGQALSLSEQFLMPAVRQGMSRLHACLLADQAWCRLNLGQMDGARADAELAETLIDARGQFDDRAPAHSRLAQVFSALGNSEAAARHHDLAISAWKGHEQLQQSTVEMLDRMLTGANSSAT